MIEQNKKISVSEFLKIVKNTLSETLPVVNLKAEIGQFSCASSGHWYFTLKDDVAQVKGVMFKLKTVRVGFMPAAGDAVEVTGVLSVYDPKGELQIVCETLKKAGQGSLYEEFLRLKAKLHSEGLFDQARKRKLPKYVFSVGVITSPQAAAWADLQTTLQRRVPHVRVTLYASSVQGQWAKTQLVHALELADQGFHDVLIVARGGGSLEDLWAFNEECVVRQIAQTHTPVIVGVGHESDVTLAEFVADLRAPTPTAAAELCSESTAALLSLLEGLWQSLSIGSDRWVQQAFQRTDFAELALVKPESRLLATQQHLNRMLSDFQFRLNHYVRVCAERVKLSHNNLQQAGSRRVGKIELGLDQQMHQAVRGARQAYARQALQVQHHESLLNAVSPQKNLKRGYALLSDQSSGALVSSIQQVKPSQSLLATLADGSIQIQVIENLSEDHLSS